MKRFLLTIITLLALSTAAQAAVTAGTTTAAKKDYTDALVLKTLKIALYNSASATLSPATTAYTTAGEVTGAGYTAGGQTLTNCTSTLNGNIAQATCDAPSWSASSITADSALIYIPAESNRALTVYTFTPATSNNSIFTFTMPANLIFAQ